MEKVNWQNNWMGGMVMGECENWQKKSYIAQKIVNIPNEDMEYYH
jgi:hypothetical protein